MDFQQLSDLRVAKTRELQKEINAKTVIRNRLTKCLIEHLPRYDCECRNGEELRDDPGKIRVRKVESQ